MDDETNGNQKLQNQLNELRHENQELKSKDPKKKRKRKKKKKEQPPSMDKLLLIMNSMNDQISKLADAVQGNTQINSNSNIDVTRLYRGAHGGTLDLSESEEEDDDDRKTNEMNRTVIEKPDVRRAPNPNEILRKDLREYLLDKVLTVE